MGRLRLAGLEQQFEMLTSGGAKLMLATFPYTRPCVWSTLTNGDELEQCTRRREAALNDIYRAFAAQHPDKVVLVDLNALRLAREASTAISTSTASGCVTTASTSRPAARRSLRAGWRRRSSPPPAAPHRNSRRSGPLSFT